MEILTLSATTLILMPGLGHVGRSWSQMHREGDTPTLTGHLGPPGPPQNKNHHSWHALFKVSCFGIFIQPWRVIVHHHCKRSLPCISLCPQAQKLHSLLSFVIIMMCFIKQIALLQTAISALKGEEHLPFPYLYLKFGIERQLDHLISSLHPVVEDIIPSMHALHTQFTDCVILF